MPYCCIPVSAISLTYRLYCRCIGRIADVSAVSPRYWLYRGCISSIGSIQPQFVMDDICHLRYFPLVYITHMTLWGHFVFLGFVHILKNTHFTLWGHQVFYTYFEKITCLYTFFEENTCFYKFERIKGVGLHFLKKISCLFTILHYLSIVNAFVRYSNMSH